MKLTLVIAVLSVSLTATLDAAASGQSQSETASNSSQVQLWTNSERLEGLKDIAFDFDTHESASEQAILEANAQWLKDHSDVRFRLAGYTDVRGNIVYNLVLSQRRAETVKRELIQMGIAENRIEYATGWGELYPNCLESTEECWQHQRRVVFERAIK